MVLRQVGGLMLELCMTATHAFNDTGPASGLHEVDLWLVDVDSRNNARAVVYSVFRLTAAASLAAACLIRGASRSVTHLSLCTHSPLVCLPVCVLWLFPPAAAAGPGIADSAATGSCTQLTG
jgi:hypothetical protein